jgi:hypothetical protein
VKLFIKNQRGVKVQNFRADLDKPVFTTKYVMRKNSPITYVYHDEDGDWQFFGPEADIKNEDVMVVSLGQIIEHDPTIREIADLPTGAVAIRANQNASWERGLE